MANVLIIGAAGRMGNWFYRYLTYIRNQEDNLLKNNLLQIKKVKKNGLNINKIFLVDSRNLDNIVAEQDVYMSNQISDFIDKSNIVIFCTPTQITINLLKKLLKYFKSGTTVVEVSSIKNQIYKKLEKYSRLRSEIQFLSIHPMFGPGAPVSSPSNIILHVLVNSLSKPRQTRLIKAIFPNFTIITLEKPESHDTLVSLMISLIYFMNLVFSKTLIDTIAGLDIETKKSKLKFLKQISGSSYKIQSVLSESILTDDASLFIGLFLGSPVSKQIIRRYGRLYNQLAAKLEDKNKPYLKNYILKTKKEVSEQVNLEDSYEILYRFLNK